jgi:hypothetical protein
MKTQARWLIFLCASWTLQAHALGQSPTEEKYHMEQRMAEGISAMLDKFLGPGKSHVTVVLDIEALELSGAAGGLKDAVASPGASRGAGSSTQWLWKDYLKKPKASILPGFLMGAELRRLEGKDKDLKRTPTSDLMEGGPVYAMAVKRHLVTVILDASVAEKYERLSQMMISEVLGLDPDRGDKINMYKLPLLSTWRWALLKPETVQDLFWMLMSLLAAAALLWLIKNFTAGAIQSLKQLSLKRPPAQAQPAPCAAAAADNAKGGGKAPSEPAAKGEAAIALRDSPGGRRDWDFINPDNLGLLVELLEREGASEAAAVLGFLEPGLSSQALELLESPFREDVLVELSHASTMDPCLLWKLRSKWKDRLSNAFGGADAMGELLSLLDKPVETALIGRIGALSPEMARRLQAKVMSFERIFDLSDSDLAAVLKEVPYPDWAQALVETPEAFAGRLLKLIPEESGKVLRGWLDLRPAKAGVRTKQARIRVLQAYRALHRSGKISPVAATARPKPSPEPHAAQAAKEVRKGG